MDLERIRRAIDQVLDLHRGQTWPGSRIPYVAHALEVACRVAALGGAEDTILAALFHDARRDRDEGGLLAELRAAHGDRVAELLKTCWDQHLLPHSGWEAWAPGAAPEDQELQLLLAGDALCCFRNLLMDWQVLAHLWDDPPKGEFSDRLWLQREAHLPDANQLVRGQWVPASAEPSDLPLVRQDLIAFFERWTALPAPDPAPSYAFPALALAHQAGAWERWVEGQEPVLHLAAWGLTGIAEELRVLLGRLRALPSLARAGFLRRCGRDPKLLIPVVAAECLRKMTMVELMLVLSNSHSKLVQTFRRQVPECLQGLLPEGRLQLELATLGEPILLHWLGEVASEGRLLAFPPLGRGGDEVAGPGPVPFPISDQVGPALSLLFAAHAGETWPATTIPYIFHALEVMSLVLTCGWDEATALVALLHDLPRTDESLIQVREEVGPDAMDSLSAFWRLGGLGHRVTGPDRGFLGIESAPAPLVAVALMDATSVLRFVAEDYQSVSELKVARHDSTRHDLANRLLFFKGFLHGRPLRNLAETVLIESRFGQGMAEWRKVADGARTRPCQEFITQDAQLREGAEEIMVLLARLEIPMPELLGLGCLLESMDAWALRGLLDSVGTQNAVAAFRDPAWEPLWKVIRDRLEPWYFNQFETLRHNPEEGLESIRRGQKAILATAARMNGTPWRLSAR